MRAIIADAFTLVHDSVFTRALRALHALHTASGGCLLQD